MTAWYNEHDKYAAQWLRNLIDAGHIAPGIVDERSIEDVHPRDLDGFTQCHFFAGIGVWSYALRLAGWSDDRPVWTGSCPCQPFSDAGAGSAFDDKRHLWPHWFHLIERAKPRTVPVFGEQVASKDGLAWIDLVQTDLEGAHHAVGTVDLCSAGVGAPHIRQRLLFVGHPDDEGRGRRNARAVLGAKGETAGRMRRVVDGAEPAGATGLLGNAGNAGNERLARRVGFRGIPEISSGAGAREATERTSVHAGGMADSQKHGRVEGRRLVEERAGLGDDSNALALADDDDSRRQRFASLRVRGSDLYDPDGRCPVSGAWADAEWIYCRDGKWRPVSSGTFPLAHGAPQRVGRLRGYGNAVNAQATAEFIRAYLATAASGI